MLRNVFCGIKNGVWNRIIVIDDGRWGCMW